MDTETLDKLYLEWSQFTKARNSRELRLVAELSKAVSHVEHMAAWIGNQNKGYSFESLGKDMPGMLSAIENKPTRLHFTNEWLKAKIEADPEDTP